MMKKWILYVSVIGLLFSSCKKIIDVSTKNAEPQLVIEGNISDRFIAQQIKISKSVAYDERNVFPAVSNAIVSVSDSRGNKYNFTESQPGLYVYGMRGMPGVTYTMSVELEGKTYTATSTMPAVVKMDSIGIVKNSFFGSDTKVAAAFISDPPNVANYYHFNLYVNGKASNRVYVNNDRLTDGNRLRLQLFYSDDSDNDDDGLKTGDNVAIEMANIDANIFNYWYALSQQSGRGPNQGTTPSNPTSNIKNGALGYFSAQTYQWLTLAVP